jgi:hypothetical protein
VEDYEKCRDSLAELLEWHRAKPDLLNEADTRLKLIDRLFFECLGWSLDDVNLEEPHGPEYADYTFLAPRRMLILEAKREGNYFEVAVGKDRIEYSIPSLMRDYPGLKSALEQVSRYCQSRGAPFAAVCNGYQIVAFIATRNDGFPPLDGRAVVFPSLRLMLERFLDLWQVLSKPAIEQKLLYSKLIGDLIPEVPAKLSATIVSYPGIKDRNVFQTDLQILSELLIEDIARSPGLEQIFLEECYCQSGALSQHSLVSKGMLSARYEMMFDADAHGPTTVPAMTRHGITPELVGNSLSRRPIILIGDVGVGKTTFIRHLIKIDAAELFENAVSLYLDLGSQATLTEDIHIFVVDEITRQLNDNYQIDIFEHNFVHGVYDAEIRRFRRSIYRDLLKSDPDQFRIKEIEFLEQQTADRQRHLRRSFEHIVKAQKKQVVAFLDNADQRSDDVQQKVFLIAQELAEHWPGTVFVALRPETFHRSQREGTLSGYHPKAFTISPPRVDTVILRRLDFVLKFTSGSLPVNQFESQITVNLTKLDAVIRALLQSLDRNNGRNPLTEFLDNICGGNIRLALDLVRGFFGSGHVDTEKIVHLQEEGGYIVPLHEFLRAVMFGDDEYYASGRSPIVNLFDVSTLDPREHFLVPLLLGALNQLGSSGGEAGFVETAVIYERLQGLGFTPEQIDISVVRAQKGRLIEAVARKAPELGESMPSAFRATTVGIYHIAKLAGFFTYHDAMLVDTPILREDVRGLIHNVGNIVDRLERAEIFRRYLDEQWQAVGTAEAFDWPSRSNELMMEIERIRGRPGISKVQPPRAGD